MVLDVTFLDKYRNRYTQITYTMEYTTQGNARKLTGLSYIGKVNSSAKIVKNMKVSNNYTYVIYLAPANLSGYNVCKFSTPECRMGCLNTSGRAGIEIMSHIDKISNSRIKKTKLFFEENKFFMEWVIAEIKKYQLMAIKDGYDFSIRLNGTSDIDWSKVLYNGFNLFQLFPMIQFYDYTKSYEKMINNNATNYHLTFSYTGYNWGKCKLLLENGYNVAMVFDTKKGKALPKQYFKFNVVDGDLTDFRPNDGNGVIVGLRFKLIADRTKQAMVINSPFVVKEKVDTYVQCQSKLIAV